MLDQRGHIVKDAIKFMQEARLYDEEGHLMPMYR